MAADVDCSYTDSNNTFHENRCSGDTVFCCITGDVKTCSTSTCGTGTSNSLATYAFWLILAGVAVLGVILLLVTYAICRYRKPADWFGHRKSIFGETISQADQDRVTSRRGSTRRGSTRRGSNRPSLPEFHLQLGNFRQGIGNPVTVRTGNSNMRTEISNLAQSRWTILNNFNSRHQGNRRSESKEEILKSKDSLPDVQD